MNQRHKVTVAPELGEPSDTRAGTSAPVLIIAYGNPLRSDDGLAWHVADELERIFSANEAVILRRHQLTPELAEELSRYHSAIFVDAAVSEAGSSVREEISVEEILASPCESAGGIRFSHQCSPTSLMEMTAQLYRARPKALCVTLTGDNFEHGDSLSPEVKGSLPRLVARIEALVRQNAESQTRQQSPA